MRNELMEELLPVLVEECIIDREEFSLKKIAKFSHDFYVYVFGDEWHIRTDSGKLYIISEGGKKISRYKKSPAEDEINQEEQSEEDKRFIAEHKHTYLEILPVGNEIYRVEEYHPEGNLMKLVDGCNRAISEEYSDIYGQVAPFVTKRWTDKGELHGLMDEKGDTIIEGAFKISATRFPVYSNAKRRLVIYINNLFGVIDYDGNVLVPPRYRGISYIHDDLIVARLDDEKDVLISETGEELLEADFISVWGNKIVVYNKGHATEMFEYERKKEFQHNFSKVDEFYSEISGGEKDIKSIALSRLGDLARRLMRLHLPEKKISDETFHLLLDKIGEGTWEDKIESAIKINKILDSCCTEADILERIKGEI